MYKERHKNTELYDNILRDGVILMDKFTTKLQNYQNALARLQESLEEAKPATV